MARTVIPILVYGRGTKKVVVSAISAVAGNTVDGMSLANDGRTVVDVHNTNAGSTAHDMTYPVAGAVEGQTVTVTESVVAAQTWGIGPFPLDLYGPVVKITAAHAELTFIARQIPNV